MLQEVRVAIIEEFRFMRDLLSSVVRSLPDFTVVMQTSILDDAFERLPGAKPQVVLLDIDMPNAKNGDAITNILKINPSIGVICTSQRWDETDARLAIQSGAKGYLVKPFTAEQLLQAVQAFEGPTLLPVSEIITIISPKGNCGKTTLAVNLAEGLVQESGHRVGIMDADLQFGDTPVFLNIDPAITIVEASRDLINLSALTMGAYLTSYNKNIKVLAPPSRPELADLVKQEHLLTILKNLRSLFRYVVVDTASGFQESTLELAEASNIIYLASSINSSFDLDHLKQSVELLRSLGYPQEKVRVVLSRIKTRGNMDFLYQLREELYYPITALLPNQFQLATNAINNGVPLLAAKSGTELALGIRGIAKDIVESAKRNKKRE